MAEPDGVFVVRPSGWRADSPGRYVLRIPAGGVHPEAAGAYCDTPMGSTSGHDDSDALNALANYIAANGSGTIAQTAGKPTGCYVAGQDFELKPGVTLAGAGMPLSMSFEVARAFQPFILLDPRRRLHCWPSSEIRDLVVMRAGLHGNPRSMEEAYEYQTRTIADRSVGVYSDNGDCTVRRVMIVGFNKGMYAVNSGRLLVDTLYGDDANVLEVTANPDTSFISKVRGFNFWGFSVNGRVGAFAASVVDAGKGYADGDELTIEDARCSTSPKLIASTKRGALVSLTIEDSGDCETSPQSYAATEATVASGGSNGRDGTARVTAEGGGCARPPQFDVTISKGAIARVEAIADPGACERVGGLPPVSGVRGAGLSGARLRIEMNKAPLALKGGAGSHGRATLSTQSSGYRPGVCFSAHDQADGLDVQGVECEEYQTQVYLSNIWNAKLWDVGGEGGYENADHEPVGIHTENCLVDTTLYNPNADGEAIDLLLQHRSPEAGGDCGKAQDASLTLIGGAPGYNSGMTRAVIRTGPGSRGVIDDMTLGWDGRGYPPSIQIGPGSGLWRFGVMQFKGSSPSSFNQWIAVSPDATPPTSQQFAAVFPGSWLLNGDFALDQPNEGATNANTLVADRWRMVDTSDAHWSARRARTGPPPYAFSEAFTSQADNTLASGRLAMTQTIGAERPSQLRWGTREAQPLIIDLCLRASAGGVYSASVHDAGRTRSNVADLPVDAANVWRCFSKVIAGPTTGGWPTDEKAGALVVELNLGASPGAATPHTETWLDGAFFAGAGHARWAATRGATLEAAAFHLRPGPFAPSSYQPKDLDEEWVEARRYFQKSLPRGAPIGPARGAAGASTFLTLAATGAALQSVVFSPPMADIPTVAFGSTETATDHCFDATRKKDGGAALAVNVGNAGFALVCALEGAGAGDRFEVQWWADVGY